MTHQHSKPHAFVLLWLLFVGFVQVMQLTWAQDAIAVPKLTTPVMDTANMMSDTARRQLDQQLRQYAQEKGSQIVVLTVASTQGESTFDYGARVMESWRLGRKGVDDGVLLLIVRDDRRMQLLVGRGLEGAIPDAYARRILDDIVTPAFQKQDVDAGIVAAVTQIQKLIAGEDLPAPTQQQSNGNGNSVDGMLMVGSIVWMISQLIRAMFGKTLAAVLGAGMGFLAAFFTGMGFLSGVLLAFILFVLIISGFVPIGGMGGGRGNGGGRSGGGGFGGSGGGFGGGGASGRW